MKFWRGWAAGLVLGSVALAQSAQRPAEKPQVLFSGQPQTEKTQATAQASKMSDAERAAVTMTAWDLDVHLAPREQSMEVHARVTVRNDGATALAAIPLQLSSTLHFEAIGLQGKRIAFAQNTIASDADHTGHLNEAVFRLQQALAPGGELTLDVDYGGTIPLDAERLTAIGAPAETAEASDWDRISEDFTGVRGFGNVVWYPVSSVPVGLGEGAKVFTEIGRQKLEDQDATASVRITEEFFGQPPNAAILDGHFVALDHPKAMPTASFPGVVTGSLPSTGLGFETPSLFLVRRSVTEGNGLRVLATEADVASAQRYVAAAGLAQPLIRTWLGEKRTEEATILDLPETGDAAAETDDVLATPLSTDDPAHLAPVVVQALAHAAFWSPRAWLNEGVASFVSTLWIESKEGQTAALEDMNAQRPALALAEPGTPGESAGEDLLHAQDAAYFRTKATYVLWMLRELAGDKALAGALAAYDPERDTTPDYFEHLAEQASGRDLRWFFDDWVNRDRGLPDLSIGGVFPSSEAHQQVLVAIEIANDGYVQAEVPVTVKGMDAGTTQWVRVPAHGSVTYRVTFHEMPTEVDVNDGTVPEVEDSMHRKLLARQ
jgi:hypothetical protein